ncbi:MAG TPA: CTP synthase [Candidatus Jorgensenbacteria bacterium]|nr:CTP synthase [Candidatus Jorgensenbacteria bacterium]
MKRAKYIFVVGGVMSGVGKGITSSSIGKLLQTRGFSVSAIKIDPYINVDAGTMNPTEHGEVFVLEDGTECDQDMGNYERFLGRYLDGRNYMTTGSIYQSVIQKERNLEYRGKCVSVVPHIPLEVISKIDSALKKDKAEIMITEIGGTVGEYENILFLEAIRVLKHKKPNDVLLVLVSYLPYQGDGKELKTKPTQHAVRDLHLAGLHPDIIIARAKIPIDKKRKEKIAFNCGVDETEVISAPDIVSIYKVPLNFEKENLTKILLEKLRIKSNNRVSTKSFSEWQRLVRTVENPRGSVKIGIVGKYFSTGDYVLSDSYISVIEAIKHAAYALKYEPKIEWIDSSEFEPKSKSYRRELRKLSNYGGIIVPGGFGSRGVDGKLNAIRYCRENKIPFFGLCYGMQLALVEFARNVCGLKNAHTTEIDKNTPYPVIDLLPGQRDIMARSNYGATMRLGAYPAVLKSKSIVHSAYHTSDGEFISERHRHRYEVNPDYIGKFEADGLVFSGMSPDHKLMEIAELPKSRHPFFVATQFHPEFKSRPLDPHPLFLTFVKSAMKL